MPIIRLYHKNIPGIKLDFSVTEISLLVIQFVFLAKMERTYIFSKHKLKTKNSNFYEKSYACIE